MSEKYVKVKLQSMKAFNISFQQKLSKFSMEGFGLEKHYKQSIY